MDRRTFIKNTAAAGAIICIPSFTWASQQKAFTAEELMGKAEIDLFGNGIQLRKEASDSFYAMREAARLDGIEIKIASGYRNFSRQKAIFERKFDAYTEDGMEPLQAIDKIIEYSTIPGTSRHHWATDIDIIDGNIKAEGDVLVPAKFGPGGPYEKLKLWMDENAKEFGYYLVYTDQPKRRGFKYEPWHYSYAPLSIPMLSTFRRMNIMQLLQRENFKGCEHFTTGFIKTYIRDNILDINPELL